MSINILMVAEKPSICTAIANALSHGSMDSRGKTPPVHEFHANFRGKNAFFRVTSVTGHVFSVDFPPQFQRWEAVDPIELFSAPILSLPEGKGGIVKHLEREAKGMDYLILWLDCDREGENICFEVIRCCEKSMNRSNSRDPRILRAHFSAVTPKDIEKAMQNLGFPNENESKAVEARQELDLKVGVAFSRFQTRYFQGKYGDLDSTVISYGPCQTPTLNFCVARSDEIQTFSPEPFWTVDCTVDASICIPNPSSSSPSTFARTIAVDWSRGRLFDQGIAEVFAKMIEEDESLLCTSLRVSESRQSRPTPMNTVELLKLASRQLGIGPQAAMRSAEHLYLSGYISYPRTESTAYPSSFDVREVLGIFRSSHEWRDLVLPLVSNGHTSPRHGHDAGDHPPITPVGLAEGLSGDDGRIYEMVVRHFLAIVSRDATFQVTKAKFEGLKSHEKFSAMGRRMLDPGFLAVFGSAATTRGQAYEEEAGDEGVGDEEEEIVAGGTGLIELPPIEEGMVLRINSLRLRQGQTSPPGYITESELIGMMEKNGIGTDASISTHINNILVRNYVSLGPGRTLVPTPLGVVLVHGYHAIDSDLVLPDVRSAIEKFCDMIAKGLATKEQVVEHSLRNFESKYRYFTSHIESMNSLFEASFSPLAQTGKFLSRCGKCLRYMRYIPLSPQRLYCPTCEQTYSLPQNGTIKLYMESKCPLDNFELVLFSLGNTAGAQGKSYPLCPFCFNNPPDFESFASSPSSGEEKESVVVSGGGGGGGGESEERTGLKESTPPSSSSPKFEVPSTHMGCNSCLHPSCKHSATQNMLCECPGTADKGGSPCPGMLILDVTSKPNWKLGCNVCNTLLRIKGEIHSITPLRQQCEECGLRMATFEFNKLKSPLPNKETTRTGCIVCDDFLNSLTEIVAGRTINLQVLKQRRANRARAGRGGRGRGRGGGRGRGS